MSVYNEQMIRETIQRIEPGSPVMTADGHEIGKVSELGQDHFKVTALLTKDYWVDGEYIVSYDDGAVKMSFDKKDAAAYRLPSPEMHDDPTVEQKDTIIPVDEQLEQRRRMEAQLEEQRRQREMRKSA
jgi:hypothetical protein